MTMRTFGTSAAALAFLLAACGGGAEATPVESPTNAATSSASSAPPPQQELPALSIRRSDVHAMIEAGLGAFLQELMQHVTLDEHPVMESGKFHGFRVKSVAGDWSHVDLKRGDVITSVNGSPIEKPEQALETFKSLDVASELRIAYERNGDPRELRYSIFEDVAPPSAKPASSASAPASVPSAAPAKH